MTVVVVMIIGAIKVRIILGFAFQLGVGELPQIFIEQGVIRVLEAIDFKERREVRFAPLSLKPSWRAHISADWVHNVGNYGHCSLNNAYIVLANCFDSCRDYVFSNVDNHSTAGLCWN